jgi:two-component system, cell cycle response regulator CpdR
MELIGNTEWQEDCSALSCDLFEGTTMAAASRILIVDDEAPIRGFLSLTFEQAGYVVKTAVNGREAMVLCANESFDVVLSDVMMPEMDGHQLAQWLATHRPSTRTALMSGFDPHCEECGLPKRCRLIAKPFHSGQIVSFVEQILAEEMPS